MLGFPWEEKSKENLTEEKREPSSLEVAGWPEGHLGTEVSRIEYSVICIASI